MTSEKRIAQMPPMYRAKYKRAISGRSMRAAIDSFCLECMGYSRTEIPVCTDTGCPLYSYRPYQKSEVAHDRVNNDQELTNEEIGML